MFLRFLRYILPYLTEEEMTQQLGHKTELTVFEHKITIFFFQNPNILGCLTITQIHHLQTRENVLRLSHIMNTMINLHIVIFLMIKFILCS